MFGYQKDGGDEPLTPEQMAINSQMSSAEENALLHGTAYKAVGPDGEAWLIESLEDHNLFREAWAAHDQAVVDAINERDQEENSDQ